MKYLLSITVILLIFSLSSCEEYQKKRDEYYNVSLHELQFRDFDELDISTIGEIELIESDSFGVKIKTTKYILDRLKIEQSGKKLTIDYGNKKIKWNKRKKELKILVYLPTLSKLKVSGFSNIKCLGTFTDSEKMEFDITGASSLSANVNTPQLDISSSAASDLYLTGVAKELNLDISGAASIDAYNLITNRTNIDVSGASDIKVSVLEELSIDASGASDISYKGDPRVIKNVSGISDIQKTGTIDTAMENKNADTTSTKDTIEVVDRTIEWK